MERYRSREQNLAGFFLVLALHVAVGYALLTVLHRTVIDTFRPPMDTRIIKDLPRPPLEPPPLPPPRISSAPSVTVPMPEVALATPVDSPLSAIRIEKPGDVRPPVASTIGPASAGVAAPVRKEFKPAYRVDPIYPYAAQRQGLDGTVVARVHVAADGTVSQVEIVASTSPLFAREVLRTLSQWRFKPEPVGFVGEYTINFTLQE